MWSWIFILMFSFGMSFSSSVFSFPQVRIVSVQSQPIQGPAHHGLVVETSGIQDPNLSFYEVNIKPDSDGPFPPYAIYNTEVQPFDSSLIVVPYRDGVFSIKLGERYCVRVRAIYGVQATPWAEHCGVATHMPPVPEGDADRDGLSDADEYARGLDPNNRDVDGDGLSDGVEVDQSSDPEREQITRLTIRQPNINFGNGNRFGTRANQHKYIEIENIGDAPARLDFIDVPQGQDEQLRNTFKWGNLPDFISAVPPQNIARIPVDFFPVRRGPIEGTIELHGNSDQELPPILLSGTGVGFADCQINPTHLDFGTVDVRDQNVLKRSFTIANRSDNRNAPANPDTPLTFTLLSSDPEVVPMLNVYSLAVGEEIEVPVVFRHLTAGDHNGTIQVQSPDCGNVSIEFEGVAR